MHIHKGSSTCSSAVISPPACTFSSNARNTSAPPASGQSSQLIKNKKRSYTYKAATVSEAVPTCKDMSHMCFERRRA